MVLAKEDDPMSFTSSAGVMRHRFLWLGMLLVMLSALGLALPAAADGVVNASSFTGTAIEGVDPVAYFTQGKPVEGKSEFAHDWMDATWYFASAENRDLFAADPEKYAPEYGGYCAWAVANGYTAKIDPEAWTIVDDKLYLNYSKDVQAQLGAGRSRQHHQRRCQLAEDSRRPRRVSDTPPRPAAMSVQSR
jgi:YHS domain-containing protein